MNKKVFDFQIKQVGPESNRVLRFTGTSELEDRDGDVLNTSGWIWDNYMKNPVFLAMHDHKILPVGRTIKITPDYAAKKTSFDVKFPTIEELSSNPKTPSDHALFADTVYKMYQNRYLHAVSIGFKGIDWEPRTASNGMQGRLYKKMECYELSAVTIPSNPGCIVEARSKGIISASQAKMLQDKGEFDLASIKLPKEKDPVLDSIIHMPAGYKPYKPKEKPVKVVLDLGAQKSVLKGAEAEQHIKDERNKRRWY